MPNGEKKRKLPTLEEYLGKYAKAGPPITPSAPTAVAELPPEPKWFPAPQEVSPVSEKVTPLYFPPPSEEVEDNIIEKVWGFLTGKSPEMRAINKRLQKEATESSLGQAIETFEKTPVPGFEQVTFGTVIHDLAPAILIAGGLPPTFKTLQAIDALPQLMKQAGQKGINKAGQAALNKALDTGLDKWIATKGRLTAEGRTAFQNWLLKDRNWLIDRATQNMLRRQVAARGVKPNIQKAAQEAADDTIKEIETRLLQSPEGAQIVKAPPRALVPTPEAAKPPPVTPKPPAPEVTREATLEEQIRSVYTPEKADTAREALTKLLSGTYDQVIVREGGVAGEIKALKAAGFDTSKFNLPVSGKVATREQFSKMVDTANQFFRALNKVEAELRIPKAEVARAPEPAPSAPVAGVTPPEVPVLGEAPPTIPPSPVKPPTAEVPTPAPPSLTQLNKIIEQSQAVVRRDRPASLTNVLNRIPGIKQVLQFERPGLFMQEENENILVAHVAEAAARNDVAARAFATSGILNDLREAFGIKTGLKGKGALHGDKTTVKFIGTPEQKNPIVGTIKDIADRPELYELSDAQKIALTKLDQRNTELLEFVTSGYGAEIGKYPAKEGGAFLPNVDISEEAIEVIGSEMRAIASGRQKARFYPTAADRMAHTPSFKPELDIEKLLTGMDLAKGRAAAAQTFKQVIGGKTRLEVMEETHPALAKKMEALRKRLTSLRGSAGRLNEKLDKAVSDFLSSPIEGVDLANVQSALDVKLARGPRAGENIKDIQKEIDGVRAQIKALKPAWEVANLKPYQFVQQGIYRYFTAEQAGLIRELLKVSDNPFLNLVESIRGGAFSGDLSPIVSIQVPIGMMADPIGAFTMAGGGLKSMIETKNPLISFSIEGLQRQVQKDPEGWAQFFSLVGRVPTGTPQEFAGGYLRRLPGFSKFTEDTFAVVTSQAKFLYDKNWKSLVKAGLPELDAKIAAAHTAGSLLMVQTELLGQSPAKQALFRAIPTSYSFIRKPAEMTLLASKGFAKTATFQRITAEELISMKLITSIIASITVISVISQAYDAHRKGNDVNKAILKALDPSPDNGKFMSIVYGNIRVPIGGPYRALIRAIYPEKVTVGGVTVYIPFLGLGMYLKNRISPFLRTQIDLIRNEDYYGQKIYKGDIAERILRVLAYEFEGALPLTAGSAVEAARTGMGREETLTQVIGQFAGSNIIENKWYEVQSLRERYSAQDHGTTYDKLNAAQKDDLVRKHTDLQSVYDEAKKELLIRGKDLPKVYALLTNVAVAERNAKLIKAGQSLLDGDISKEFYDNKRHDARIYYSASRSMLWEFKTELDPEQAKQIEQYYNESAKPEDKALDDYWEYYSKLIGEQKLPENWDAINAQLSVFVKQYPAEIQKYILENKDSWIKDLPQPARMVEETRLRQIADETWWDDYREAFPSQIAPAAPSISPIEMTPGLREYLGKYAE